MIRGATFSAAFVAALAACALLVRLPVGAVEGVAAATQGLTGSSLGMAAATACCNGTSGDASAGPVGSCRCIFSADPTSATSLPPTLSAVNTWFGSAEQSYGGASSQCVESKMVTVSGGTINMATESVNYSPAQCPANGFDPSASPTVTLDASTSYGVSMVQTTAFTFTGGTLETQIQQPSSANGAIPWMTPFIVGAACQLPNELAGYINGWITGGTTKCYWPITGPGTEGPAWEFDYYEHSQGQTNLDIAGYFSGLPGGCTGTPITGSISCPGSSYTIAYIAEPANAETQLVTVDVVWSPGKYIDIWWAGVLELPFGGTHTWDGSSGMTDGGNWIPATPGFPLFLYQMFTGDAGTGTLLKVGKTTITQGPTECTVNGAWACSHS